MQDKVVLGCAVGVIGAAGGAIGFWTTSSDELFRSAAITAYTLIGALIGGVAPPLAALLWALVERIRERERT